jgi:hypothetical protein
MIKACFDWNIIAKYRDYYLKKDTSASTYGLIQEAITNGQIATYYSDAHILDILPLSAQSQYTGLDLKAISLITGDAYLAYDSISKYWEFQRVNPSDVFDNQRENYHFQCDFESISGDCGFLGVLIKEFLSNVKLPTCDQMKEENYPSDLLGFMRHMIAQNNEAISNSRFYRTRRNKFVSQLNNQQPYKAKLSGSIEDKLLVFIELYIAITKAAPKMFEDRLSHILGVFMLLDQVHLWTDSQFKNLQVDAMHAFYATHSSTKYLVTNDKNMIRKSQLAYLCLGLSIQVVNFFDFAKIFSVS